MLTQASSTVLAMPAEWDVAIVGAGIAGLVCAQNLSQAGLRVGILEKSRGVGGRVATRRLHHTCADHGTCYLSPQGEAFRAFIDSLQTAGVVQVWTDTVHEMDGTGQITADPDRYPRYVAPAGMTAIAKALATNLDIRFSHRVHTLALTDDRRWSLTAECPTEIAPNGAAEFTASSLVLAIPAPQAAALVQSLAGILPDAFLSTLNGVDYLPSMAVMAGYAPEHQADWDQQYPGVRSLTFAQHLALGWIGLDSSKRPPAPQPVFVIQSTGGLAADALDTPDLQPVAQTLLDAAAASLRPWFATPEWFQVHRWRYAFPKSPLTQPFLDGTVDQQNARGRRAILLCCGDWCGGRKVEAAFRSGAATADRLLGRVIN